MPGKRAESLSLVVRPTVVSLRPSVETRRIREDRKRWPVRVLLLTGLPRVAFRREIRIPSGVIQKSIVAVIEGRGVDADCNVSSIREYLVCLIPVWNKRRPFSGKIVFAALIVATSRVGLREEELVIRLHDGAVRIGRTRGEPTEMGHCLCVLFLGSNQSVGSAGEVILLRKKNPPSALPQPFHRRSPAKPAKFSRGRLCR